MAEAQARMLKALIMRPLHCGECGKPVKGTLIINLTSKQQSQVSTQ